MFAIGIIFNSKKTSNIKNPIVKVTSIQSLNINTKTKNKNRKKKLNREGYNNYISNDHQN